MEIIMRRFLQREYSNDHSFMTAVFSKVELFFSQILIDKIINWRYLFLFTCMQCFNEVATHGAL